MDTQPGLGFRMHAERTPNPQSVKWVLGEALLEPPASANFQEPVDAEVSPLAARLFAVDGVVGVFLAANFVTVTKRDDLEWQELAEPVVGAIKAHAASGEPALGPAFEAAPALPDDEIAGRIRSIIEQEIRPAVAMDGGDVVFVGFRDGVVEVMLQGSCVGCPSSTITLRYGIEARLKEAVPEVTEVVQI